MRSEFASLGQWKRQDPGFPDVIFEGNIVPAPGFEVKAWFPMATEITGRFKDSQNRFTRDQTQVVLLAWLPEYLIFGRPYVLDVCIVSARSVAKARDDHYHNPPDYLVVEPNDTSTRTRNLQQTITSGLKWQGVKGERFTQAEKIVASWGAEGRTYSPKPEYQERMQELFSKYTYKVDTNYAKMDRVVHPEIEQFKKKMQASVVHGMTIKEWMRLLASRDDNRIERTLKEQLGVAWSKKLT